MLSARVRFSPGRATSVRVALTVPQVDHPQGNQRQSPGVVGDPNVDLPVMLGVIKAYRLSRKMPGIELSQRQSDALLAFHFPADPPQLANSVGVEAEGFSRLKRELAQQVDRPGGV